MGNLAQIDTPYLTEGLSGKPFAVDRFRGEQRTVLKFEALDANA